MDELFGSLIVGCKIFMTRRIFKFTVLTLFLVSMSLAAVAVTAQADADTQAKIDNAMSAGPMRIAQDATILDWAFDADGKFVVLREGTNGWSCLPDDSTTPSNDPICLDEAWLAFFYAFVAGEEPNVTVPGIGYMLQGGGSASNTDPSALAPAEGEDWMVEPPHIMIIMPSDVDISSIGSDMTTGKPWIMWAGTPYQHIMVPVMDTMEMAP